MKKKDLLIKGPKSSNRIFVLTHGAGAPMDSDWMNQVTELLTKKGIQVIRFEFPYMNERRSTGKKRPPNPMKVLQQTWKDVLEITGKDIYIGGKSMGGRVASLIADELKPKGLICLGFPFHAPGKEPKDRISHLESLKTKTLILQGERDSMGTKEEISSYNLSSKIKVIFLEDGDHSLKPRKKSGFDLNSHLEKAAEEINKFIK